MIGKFARNKESRSGSAMLVVLMMLGIIAILAAIVSRSVSGAALELRVARDAAETETDLRAGIDLGVAAILKLGDRVRSADAEVDLPDRRIAVLATNERARIDLNQADASILTALLKSVEVDDSEAAALAGNILNWRGSVSSQQTSVQDESDSHFGNSPHAGAFNSTTGFELHDTPKQRPTIRFFLHPMQLASVPGFSKRLVKAIFPLVTVANGSKKIDPFIASAGVLKALPDISSGNVDGFLDVRDGNTSPETAILLLGVDKELVADDAALGWRLQIVSTWRNGTSHHGEAVVVVLKDGTEPYRVLYVDDLGRSGGRGGF